MSENSGRAQQVEPTTSSVENVRVVRDGAYQIDLDALMKGMPLVLKLDEGIYCIDLSPSPRIP